MPHMPQFSPNCYPLVLEIAILGSLDAEKCHKTRVNVMHPCWNGDKLGCIALVLESAT